MAWASGYLSHRLLLALCLIGGREALGVEPIPNGHDAADSAAEILSLIQRGMTHKQVLEILDARRGPNRSGYWSDAHRDRFDETPAAGRYVISDRVNLIIEYGTRGHADVRADDTVTTAKVARFDDLKDQVAEGLFPYAKAVHFAPSLDAIRFDPVALIRAVNALQPLGKAKALEVLREYVRLARATDRLTYDVDDDRVFIVARVLFTRDDHDPRMPWMHIGVTSPRVQPNDLDWPLFPLLMRDDIPFYMAEGYTNLGVAESPLTHLDYCERLCSTLTAPLHPKKSPVTAVEGILSSNAWHRLTEKSKDTHYAKYRLRMQAVEALAHIRVKDMDLAELNRRRGRESPADKLWTQFLRDPHLINVRWDADSALFTDE